MRCNFAHLEELNCNSFIMIRLSGVLLFRICMNFPFKWYDLYMSLNESYDFNPTSQPNCDQMKEKAEKMGLDVD